jgi:large subunit ribosomal protein L10
MEKERENISGLDSHFQGMPALLLTKENPFKIASILKKSRTPANAKAGQIAPRDIVIPAGPTPFAPGPIISELGGIGIKTGVEGGKVAVKADSTVAKKGDEISQKVADVLSRLDIKPMELGLTMTAAYEDGIIYTRDILEVDESVYEEQLKSAAFEAFAVALHHGVMNETTIMPQLQKAARDALMLALHEDILTDDTIKQILAKAEGQAGHLQSKIKV